MANKGNLRCPIDSSGSIHDLVQMLWVEIFYLLEYNKFHAIHFLFVVVEEIQMMIVYFHVLLTKMIVAMFRFMCSWVLLSGTESYSNTKRMWCGASVLSRRFGHPFHCRPRVLYCCRYCTRTQTRGYIY